MIFGLKQIAGCKHWMPLTGREFGNRLLDLDHILGFRIITEDQLQIFLVSKPVTIFISFGAVWVLDFPIGAFLKIIILERFGVFYDFLTEADNWLQAFSAWYGSRIWKRIIEFEPYIRI